MRVIAGKYRGKRLNPPKDDSIRPTTDRVKETLFNIIQHNIGDARALDLFAGSGALGIECLSRGAAEVLFVDRNRESLDLIRKNLEGIEGNYAITAADFLSVLRNEKNKFDLIFIDPPYGSGLGKIAIDAVIKFDKLSENGIMIYEHSSKDKYFVSDALYITRSKNMGTVSAEFIRRKKIALAAGSYDPITVGHEAVIDEALKTFDEVVIACLINPDKLYMFSPEERLNLVKAATAEKKGVKALFSENSTAEVAESVHANTLIRGLRDKNDEEYEREMAEFNLGRGFRTQFVIPQTYRRVSSTSVKEEILKGEYRHVPEGAKNLLVRLVQNKI